MKGLQTLSKKQCLINSDLSMNFDPTYNYGDGDMTNDNNRICWKFGELVKNLITLSSSAARQSELIGAGAVCDEMAIDFETYFTLSYNEYTDNGLLTESQIETLKALDNYLDARSGDRSPDFWDDDLLDSNPEWEVVRQMASNILISLEMGDYDIAYEREEKYKTTDKGKQLTIQSTKTRLERKNAT
jgi:hypothetical protein